MSRATAALAPLLAIAGTLGLAAPAAALTPLGQNDYVVSRLVAAQTADILRRNCAGLSARMFHAYREARALERHALAEGYSRNEINAFVKDKAEKARVRRSAEAWLRQRGARAGNEQSYCALGRAEIAKKSYIGSFLSAN